MGTKRQYPAVVYDKEKADRYTNDLASSKLARHDSIEKIKNKVWELLRLLEESEEQINEAMATFNQTSSSADVDVWFSVRWRGSENLPYVRGPYWYFVTKKSGKKISERRYTPEILGRNKQIKSESPVKTEFRAMYPQELRENLWQLRRYIESKKREKDKIYRKLINSIKLLESLERRAHRKKVVGVYAEDSDKGLVRYQKLRHERVWYCLSYLDNSLLKMEGYEDEIEARMKEFNRITPKRWKTVYVTWKIYANSEMYKSKTPSHLGPICIEWKEIVHRKPTFHKNAMRLTRKVKAPTQLSLKKAQLGKHSKDLMRLRNYIEVYEKRRRKIRSVIARLWKSTQMLHIERGLS